MRRREVIAGIAGAAAWPLATLAQRSNRMRRIGVFMPFTNDDPEGQARVAVFRDGLHELGWVEGQNLEIDYRWAANPPLARYAVELAKEMPDAILASGTATVTALLQTTLTIPIVFGQVIDPVRQGFVASLANSGGNITGFTNFESAMPGKWLEIAKDIAPQVTRVLLIYDPETTPHDQFVQPVATAAAAFGLKLAAVGVQGALDIEHAFDEFAPKSESALIVFPAVVTGAHRQLIIESAARNRMPAVYPFRYFVTMGGLASYGINPLESFRRAAFYVDRILKGEKPANLPVQQPTKFEFVINLKTAKALGLTIPPTLLARADEVIE